jgi:substrate import-associated zinc metallohydrolase lipoprotein
MILTLNKFGPKIFSVILIAAGSVLASSCYKDESLESPVKQQTPSEDPIDIYIQENFVDKYGVSIRYKFVDRYVDPDKRVSPPLREVVQPTVDFLTQFWVTPYLSVQNGRRFFENHVPAEVILIGSLMYNDDGTVTLGTADVGARITLTDVNSLDLDDDEWLYLQLHVIYHEFAHIVHQRYNLPTNWQEISPDGYTSVGSWYTLSDEEALQRGFVSPYATSDFNEDYAEMVSFITYYPEFYDRYITDEENCTDEACVARNEGRALIRRKYVSVLNHYEQVTGVDLLDVRAVVQDLLN